MPTLAILPVKRFAHAKQRLAPSIADPLRAELAQAMVADVLDALHHTTAIARTVVVTNEPAVGELARTHDALVLPDTANQGQAAAASLGVAHALAAGFRRALCVPGDCPALDPHELSLLLGEGQEACPGSAEAAPQRIGASPRTAERAAERDHQKRGARARARVRARGGDLEDIAPSRDTHPAPSRDTDPAPGRKTDPQGKVPRREVVIVPDRHGSGTNALLLTPPDAIAPAFGPDSRKRHERLARQAGVLCRIARVSSLLLDIDTGADLAVLRERLSREHTRAPRTRAALGLAQGTPASPIARAS